MIEQEPPRTRLEQLLRQQHLTLEEFRKKYERVAPTELSERQAYRWVAGELSTLPYPAAQPPWRRCSVSRWPGCSARRTASERCGPPGGTMGMVPQRGTARTDWEGQVITTSADRARDFLTRIGASNIGAETLDQLLDDVRRLVITQQQQPLPTILGDLAGTQDRAFELLEGRQRPEQSRDLYLIAGLACGLMADASLTLGASHDAMTQARTGYACADNAGHDGLRAWIRGLQAAITYWSGQLDESLRYAQSGAEVAVRSRGTSGVWLASAEARALAALNRPEEANAALDRAVDLREHVQPDELDSLGGMCTFSRPRQLYFAAETLSWCGPPQATRAERLALDTLDAYASAPTQDRSYSHEAGTRSALAVARVTQGDVDGAAEALAPVLELPPSQRGHAVVTSVERVRTALSAAKDPGRDAIDLAGSAARPPGPPPGGYLAGRRVNASAHSPHGPVVEIPRIGR